MGAADGDHVRGDGPRDQAQRDRGDPAGVHVGEDVAPAGADQERDDRRHDQERLEPLAREDDERAGEGRARGEPRLVEPLSRLVEHGVDPGRLPFDLDRRRARRDRPAQPRELSLGAAAQVAIERVERGLDQLEALEVGGDGQTLCVGAAAVTIGGEALGEQPLAEGDRRLAPRVDQRGPRAEEREHGGALVTVLGFRLARGRRHDAREVGKGRLRLATLPQRLAAGRLGRIRREAAHPEGERPSLRVGQRAEARHPGAVDAERDRAVEAVHAALVHSRPVGEVARRRVHARRPGPSPRPAAP